MRNLRGLSEASAGVEPAMADLQSAALATWPRRLQGAVLFLFDLNGQAVWVTWATKCCLYPPNLPLFPRFKWHGLPKTNFQLRKTSFRPLSNQTLPWSPKNPQHQSTNSIFHTATHRSPNFSNRLTIDLSQKIRLPIDHTDESWLRSEGTALPSPTSDELFVYGS